MPISHGIYPVIHTPLHLDQAVDIVNFEACLRHYLTTDITGVTILGSGGELPYFSDKEQLDLLISAHHTIGTHKNIIVGLQAYSATQAIDKINLYQSYADAILLLVNRYYPVAFEDYYQSIRTIAAASDTPIIFYYFPQITKQFLTVSQLEVILLLPNIIGIKDSSLHLLTAKKLIQKCPSTLYFSGLSLMLEQLPNAAGAICPLAAIYPQQSQHYWLAIKQNNDTQSRVYHQYLKAALPIINALNMPAKWQWNLLTLLSRCPIPLLKKVASSHAQIKAALHIIGMPISPTVRHPLRSISESEIEKIRVLIAQNYQDSEAEYIKQ